MTNHLYTSLSMCACFASTSYVRCKFGKTKMHLFLDP